MAYQNILVLTGHTVGAVVSEAAQTTTICTVCGHVVPVNMTAGVKDCLREIIGKEDIAQRHQDGSLRDTNINW